jgi:hypothetical protein
LSAAVVQVRPFSFEPEIARKSFERRIEKAQARNLVPVLSYERLAGSPFAGGYDSEAIANRLAAVFPDARVLLVIREQTSMLVSIYKQYVKKGGPASLRQYLNVPSGAGRIPVFNLDFWEYHRLIGYYQGLFGTENLLVLPYEMLKAQPRTFLERIGEFLGVPATRSGFQQENVSPSALALSLKRHANRWLVRDAFNPAPPLDLRNGNKTLLRVCHKMDEKIPVALRDRHDRRWRQYAERKVGDRYAKSNALTAELIGISLREYGYACVR